MKGQRLSNVAKLLGTQIDHQNYVEYLNDRYIENYACDSRHVTTNSLFFALKGENTDGHAYLKEVSERQAAGAVISRDYEGDTFGLPVLRVEDVLASLQKLAKHALAQRDLKIVGVTGSIGKTTTKEFIAELLSAKYQVAKTPGNSNSQIGLPLSILNLSGEMEYFVVEMGMTQPGEITKLLGIAPPDAVLINKISYSHTANFSDGLNGIAKAKGEILDHPLTKIAVVHAQAYAFEGIRDRGVAAVSTFGADYADYQIEYSESVMRIIEKGVATPWFSLPFQATHLCENFLGAAALSRQLGLSWEEILKQSEKLHPFKRRFEFIEKKGILYINDCYNANPDSMKAALKNLPQPKEGGRKIAVLGSMKELGTFSEACHRDVGVHALRAVDHLLCYGQECRPIVEEFNKEGRDVDFILDFDELRARLEKMIKPGDVVLVKGSNSLRLWRLLEDE